MKLITKSNLLISLVLLSIVLYGGILRFYNLSSQSYWMDEGYTINSVLSINEDNLTKLNSNQNYQCLMYCYPTSLLTKWFGETPFNYRLFSVLINLIFIIIIFLIIKELFNKKTALLTSFFVSFSYWQIAWSRQARFYTLFTLLFWLSLFFFYKSLYYNHKKYLNISLTIIFSSLTILTTGLGCLLPLIFITWIIIDQIFIKKRINWKKNIIIIIFIFIFYLLIDFYLNINIYKYLLNNPKLYYTLPYYLNFYLRNYWLFIPFTIITLIKKDDKHKKEIWFLLLNICIYFIALSFFTNIVHYRYLFHLTPILFVLSSIEIINLHNQVNSKNIKAIIWVIILCLFFTIGGGVLIPQTNYFLESDDFNYLRNRPYYAYTPQPNWSGAYNFIQKNINDNEIVISSQPQFNKIFLNIPGYWIKYNYLGYSDISEYNNKNKEYYVGADIINNIEEFRLLTKRNHGFIVFDYMSTDNRIPKDIINYVKNNFTLIFNQEENSYSKIWIYKF